MSYYEDDRQLPPHITTHEIIEKFTTHELRLRWTEQKIKDLEIQMEFFTHCIDLDETIDEDYFTEM